MHEVNVQPEDLLARSFVRQNLTEGLKYRAEIDGLRAFAVIPVILFHMGLKWMAGGYIGVDVFFVISGFLITSILVRELESGSFSFLKFWGRRIRRILPAMIVVTAVCLAVTALFIYRPDRHLIATQAALSLMSVSNFYFWQTAGNYFGPAAGESPFLHAWSLSVEEQFYLLFPVIIFLVARLGLKWLGNVMLFVIILSLTFFLYGSLAHRNTTFYLLPGRAWELATGCYLATILFRGQGETPITESLVPLGLCGLCMLVVSYLFLPTPDGGIAIAVLGTAFIIAFARSGPCHAILSHNLFVHLGKISFSLYLWHWPVLVFAHLFGFGAPKITLFIPIYLLSIASYNLVEAPIRRRKGVIPAIGVCYLIILGLCGAMIFSSPYYDTSAFAKPRWSGHYYDLRPTPEKSSRWAIRAGAPMDEPRREAPFDAYKNGGIIIGRGDGSPRIVVLGDSHGVMWSEAIRTVTEKLGIKTAFISISGVSPFVTFPLSHDQQDPLLTPEQRYEYDESRLRFLKLWKPDIVILVCRWSKVFDTQTKDLLGELDRYAGRTLLMEQPPELASVGTRNALQYAIFRGIKPRAGESQYFPAGDPGDWESGRELIHTIAQKHPHCSIIPTSDLYLAKSQAWLLQGNNILYLDGDHLTSYGTGVAVPRIEQAITSALSSLNTESSSEHGK